MNDVSANIMRAELPSDRASYATADFDPVKQPTNKKIRFDIKRFYHLADAAMTLRKSSIPHPSYNHQ
jgi:hypothetical protein